MSRPLDQEQQRPRTIFLPPFPGEARLPAAHETAVVAAALGGHLCVRGRVVTAFPSRRLRDNLAVGHTSGATMTSPSVSMELLERRELLTAASDILVGARAHVYEYTQSGQLVRQISVPGR